MRTNSSDNKLMKSIRETVKLSHIINFIVSTSASELKAALIGSASQKVANNQKSNTSVYEKSLRAENNGSKYFQPQ